MSRSQPEYQLQKAIAEYLRTAYPKVLFLSDVRASVKLTIPQQVRAKAIQADNFACPDLIIFEPRMGFSGMFMELKAGSPFRKDGKLKSDKHLSDQIEAISRLCDRGYYAMFVWEMDSAILLIDWYLKG